MDANEEEVLSCLRGMENSDEEESIKRMVENGHVKIRHHSYHNKASLNWLELRVFYVRLSRCMIGHGESAPEILTLNHVPLDQNTLLEVNGTRIGLYSDGVSTLLKRDRLDRRSEEVTFVSTDSVRATGSMKFEVFHKSVLVLSGTLDLCQGNGGESKHRSMNWSMSCDSDVQTSRDHCSGLSTPGIEVYVAGSFSGGPIVLSKMLQLCHRRKAWKKGVMLESIPENEMAQSHDNLQPRNFQEHNQHDESQRSSPYMGMELIEDENGELSWFNAGVRVGVGIGLSVCLGLGIGVGLLIRTYQGTTRNFRRRLL